MDIKMLLSNPYILISLAFWELAWKGFALWQAVKRDDKYWYIAILVLNSFGILPIIYLILLKNPKVKIVLKAPISKEVKHTRKRRGE